MLNYSIIIPHKNCPDLLKRLLDSIPERDDVQIIVVDDNSDEGKKPSIDRKDTEVILLDAERSKGAGRARNVGLEHAEGKWLLFADADVVLNGLSIDALPLAHCHDEFVKLSCKAVEIRAYVFT